MATVDYPSQLPAPLRSNYGFEHVSPFERTTMRTGRARQRRTFTYVPSIGSFELHLSTVEAQLFEGWFKYQITDGADWFNIDLLTPVGNMAPYECRFAEMYQGPNLSALSDWRYTFPLELRERPVLNEGWSEFGAEFVLNSDIIDLALNREWPL